MTIRLEAISFNHDPNSATNAFTIRKNQLEDVAVPEWRFGMTVPEQSLAVYSVRQLTSATPITIKAEFRREAGDPTSVGVSAFEMIGNERRNVLGDVKPRMIVFDNDVVTAELELVQAPLANPGVGRWDISWIWSIGTNPNQTTNHRIYTILERPKAPWGQPGSPFRNFQLPWTEVLDHACREAEGATTLDEAAARLTSWVYSLGDSKLKYNDQGSGSPCFTIEGMDTFQCTNFLRVLNNGNGTKQGVNCTDCATILSCFANILGCDLVQSQIGFEFWTNTIRKIGTASQGSQEFSFHEVAWKIPATGHPTVYDCCLQLDGDGFPLDDNFLPTLGVNLPLGNPTGNGYRGRLIRPTRSGLASQEWPGTRIRRRIDDGGTLTRRNVEPTQLRILAEEHKFPTWSGSPKPDPKPICGRPHKPKPVATQDLSTSAQSLYLKNYRVDKDRKVVGQWKPGEIKSYKAEPDPLRVIEVIWSSTEKCSKAALRMLMYECTSLESARSFLLALLAEFHLPGITRRLEFAVGDKKVKIGDVSFAGPDDLVLLFARANNVIFIQNVGLTPVSAAPLASEIDDDMSGGPDPHTVPERGKGPFRIAGEEVSVGREILIQREAEFEPEEEETLCKFFAPAGQVRQKGRDLLYRPQAEGKQTITILARKAGETTRQELELSVKASADSPEPDCEKPDEKEPITMPDTIDIKGVWSSIRPTNNGMDSADMSLDGIIQIKDVDDSGRVTGFYRNPDLLSPTELLSGNVTFLNSHFAIRLEHELGEGRTRHYEGEMVAGDGRVTIVAGRYYDTSPEIESGVAGNSTATDTFSATAANGGQENGTWVATKP